MPRIGENAIDAFIKPSPGPAQAPGFAQAGSEVAESNIRSANSLSNAVSETGNMLSHVLLSPIGAGLGAVVTGAAKAKAQHDAIVNSRDTLLNDSTANTQVNNLDFQLAKQEKEYATKALVDPDLYNDSNLKSYLKPMQDQIDQTRKFLGTKLSGDDSTQIKALATFESQSEERLNKARMNFLNGQGAASKIKADNNAIDSFSNLKETASTGTQADLSKALSDYRNKENLTTFAIAGWDKKKVQEGHVDLVNTNFSAENANLLNSGKFLQEAKGDLIQRSKNQKAAFDSFEKRFNDDPNFLDLPGTTRQAMQKSLDTTREAIDSQRNKDIKTANLQKEYTIDDLATQAASDNPSIRANAINQLNGMLSKEHNIPAEYRSELVANKIVGAVSRVSGVQASRASNVQAVEIENKKLEASVDTQVQNAKYNSNDAVNTYNDLNRTINSYNSVVKTARANTVDGNKHTFVPDTGITVDDMGKLKQRFEDAKATLKPEEIKSFDKMIQSLTEQTVPNFKPEPQKQDSFLGLGAHQHITNEHDYTDVKTSPLNPSFAATMIGKISGADPKTPEYMNLQKAVNTRLDALRNDPAIKASNASAETIRRAVYMEMLANKHPVFIKEIPKRAEPVRYFKKTTDELIGGKVKWPTTETDKAQGR